MLKELVGKRKKRFDVTLYQTPVFSQKKGYQEVYRLPVEENNHKECLDNVFKVFNISDCIPNDYGGRYVGTGDIISIEEGRNGQSFYQLQSGGWMKINRIRLR
ncbi:YodL domain-containing protein [Bacillus sp. 1NLA3E]|jgi:hypothetical protein|uniref:YodL domain-containing protein n=1 Tax=Bacillus sp. 1NLA3E TaxID=666686 RepID=UPI000247EC91|nr:YodL domain-containing protein [Bacillus sp. 1NLA3E]AGK54384.1 hypothetical protein B1NLA3E_13180 [Bacillus sp. 1NLA3E]